MMPCSSIQTSMRRFKTRFQTRKRKSYNGGYVDPDSPAIQDAYAEEKAYDDDTDPKYELSPDEIPDVSGVPMKEVYETPGPWEPPSIAVYDSYPEEERKPTMT
jgi:hypothetical protein